LTSACDAQTYNKINSLDGAVFPAALTELQLVSSGILLILFCCALI
jgi:hypothetical protein